jgi:hypothetical protein
MTALAHHHRPLTLAEKAAKLKKRAGSIAGRGVRTLEVGAGAALGGLVQGMSKSPNGAHIVKVPADLAIGLGLHLAGFLDLAGDEWSSHLNNFGDGFIGAYFSDLGFAVGKKKKETGSFFTKGASGSLSTPAAVHGEVTPQQMAEALLRSQGA